MNNQVPNSFVGLNAYKPPRYTHGPKFTVCLVGMTIPGDYDRVYGVSIMHPYAGVAERTGLTREEAKTLADKMNRGAP